MRQQQCQNGQSMSHSGPRLSLTDSPESVISATIMILSIKWCCELFVTVPWFAIEPQNLVICINSNCRNEGFFGDFNLPKHLHPQAKAVTQQEYAT